MHKPLLSKIAFISEMKQHLIFSRILSGLIVLCLATYVHSVSMYFSLSPSGLSYIPTQIGVASPRATDQKQPKQPVACSEQVRNRQRFSAQPELVKVRKVCSQSRLHHPLPDSRSSRTVYRPSKTGRGRCEKEKWLKAVSRLFRSVPNRRSCMTLYRFLFP